MKKYKLKDLQEGLESGLNENLDRLEKAVTALPVNIVGKAFYGKKNISKKDGSYTTTLWYVFCYLPILPIESYRLTNPAEIPHSRLPKVFALDEFIHYDTRKLSLDWMQMIWTLLQIWTIAAAVLVLFLAYPLYVLIGIAGTSAGLLVYEVIATHGFKLKKRPVVDLLEKINTIEATVVVPQPPPVVPVPASEKKPAAATFQVAPKPKPPVAPEAPKPAPETKNVPTAAEQAHRASLTKNIHPVSEKYVPGLWDDMFVISSKKASLASVELGRPFGFIDFLGYVNFIVFPLYFFIYAYLSTASSSAAYYPLFSKIYTTLTDGHLLSGGSILIGMAVFIKNRALGFFIIILAILFYFNLHEGLWTYLNSLT